MNSADFQFLADFLKKGSGLVVSEDKMYLLESRLLPIARERGHNTLDGLVAELRKGTDSSLKVAVIEAMTTNESFFFRDTKPFQIFENETLPALIEARAARKRLRIWCAAASTGQEPYSLAMILKENAAKMPGWRTEILGTDLSSEVLEKAKAGMYSQFEVQRGLPISLLVKYFRQVNEMWQIDAAIRASVRFQKLNLMDNFTHLGKFDVIFCRNVLIYFDQQTKAEVLERMSTMLEPDGVLFLGGAETVLGITDKFKPVTGQRGVYQHAA